MEYFDVYDAHGNKTGIIKSLNDKFFSGEYRLAASLWIINSKGEALIQRRALNKSYHPGGWSITGGKVLSGEESMMACIREVQEEIGVLFNKNELDFMMRSFFDNIIFDDFIAFRDILHSEIKLQTEEVMAYKWADLSQIRAMHRDGLFMFEDISELNLVEARIARRQCPSA